MKKILFFPIMLIFFGGNIKSQTFGWAKRSGSSHASGDGGTAIVVDALGNSYGTGAFSDVADFDPGPGIFNLTSSPSFRCDPYIQKLDSNGNLVWAKSFSGTAYDSGTDILLDNTGNVLVGGWFRSTLDCDPGPGLNNLVSGSGGENSYFVVKLDPSGNLIWGGHIGTPSGINYTEMTIDDENNIYIIGNFNDSIDVDLGPGFHYLNSPISYLYKSFIAKYNPVGNLIWATAMGGTYNNGVQIGGIIVDEDGNIFHTGTFGGTIDFDLGSNTYNVTLPPGITCMYTAKLDSSGSCMWVKNSNQAEPFDLTLDMNKNIYTTGYFYNTNDFDPDSTNYYVSSNGSGDIFISKMDSIGHLIWAKGVGGNNSSYQEQGNAIEVDGAGNVYIGCMINSNADVDPDTNIANISGFGGLWDMLIEKLDSSGNMVWAGQMGGVGHDYCNSIDILQNGDLYYTGTFNSTVDFNPSLSTTYNITSYGAGDIVTSKFDHINCFAPPFTITQNGCDSIIFNSSSYFTSGSYLQHLITANNCDSMIDLNLGIQSSSSSILNQNVCDTAFVNSLFYTSSGTYSQIITNSAGCDSSITINVIIQQNGSSITTTECNSYTLNSNTYLNSGVYYQSFTNINGCDSIVTINLTIYDSSSSNFSATNCNNYTFNGITYSTTGIYQQTLLNAEGCDSIITLDLTINSVDNSVSQTGYTLTAQQPSATYQWIDCNNSNQPIPGETNQSFTATTNGNYAVIVTANGCSDTSACYTVFGFGLEDQNFSSGLSASPNPTHSLVNITSKVELKNATLIVTDINGKNLLQKNQLNGNSFPVDLSELNTGMYFIHIFSEGKKGILKVVKK